MERREKPTLAGRFFKIIKGWGLTYPSYLRHDFILYYIPSDCKAKFINFL